MRFKNEAPGADPKNNAKYSFIVGKSVQIHLPLVDMAKS